MAMAASDYPCRRWMVREAVLSGVSPCRSDDSKGREYEAKRFRQPRSQANGDHQPGREPRGNDERVVGVERPSHGGGLVRFAKRRVHLR